MKNTRDFEAYMEAWRRDEVGPEPRAIEHPEYPDIIETLIVGEKVYVNEEIAEEVGEEMWARADMLQEERTWYE